MHYYQQGDVLLKKINKLPASLEKLPHKVLQEGETTGHMHQFSADSLVTLFQAKRDTSSIEQLEFTTITENGNKYLEVRAPALLRHEEHLPIEIEPGIYEIDIVREYDYDRHEMRRVVD